MEKRPLNQLQEKNLSCTTLCSISLSSFFFSEPFDAASWMLVGLAAVQISAFSIFLFEWLSPAGYDMKVRIRRGISYSYIFDTHIRFLRNNQKFFNFFMTSILLPCVIKKVKSSSSPSQLATFSDFSVPSELWDALCQWSPQYYISTKQITTSLREDNHMIDSGLKWPLSMWHQSSEQKLLFARGHFVSPALVHVGHVSNYKLCQFSLAKLTLLFRVTSVFFLKIR